MTNNAIMDTENTNLSSKISYENYTDSFRKPNMKCEYCGRALSDKPTGSKTPTIVDQILDRENCRIEYFFKCPYCGTVNRVFD